MGNAGFCPSTVLQYFFLKGTIMKKSLYFFLPGYLKAQSSNMGGL